MQRKPLEEILSQVTLKDLLSSRRTGVFQIDAFSEELGLLLKMGNGMGLDPPGRKSGQGRIFILILTLRSEWKYLVESRHRISRWRRGGRRTGGWRRIWVGAVSSFFNAVFPTSSLEVSFRRRSIQVRRVRRKLLPP
jgi:hypothetical protein